MTDLLLVTGNQHKADYLAKWLGMPFDHQKLDVDEIQSLDLREVTEHKVRQAYQLVGRPVLVEDVSLTFTAMGRLPGTYIKWFLEEIGQEGLAEMANGLAHRQAIASIMYAYYDGNEIHFFDGHTKGVVAAAPRGEGVFGKKGWNSIFIPDGSDKTFAEMTDEELQPFSHRWQAIAKLKTFLENR